VFEMKEELDDGAAFMMTLGVGKAARLRADRTG